MTSNLLTLGFANNIPKDFEVCVLFRGWFPLESRVTHDLRINSMLFSEKRSINKFVWKRKQRTWPKVDVDAPISFSAPITVTISTHAFITESIKRSELLAVFRVDWIILISHDTLFN